MRALQAHELTQLVALFDAAGVDGTFIHTFVQPLKTPTTLTPVRLDMASIQPRQELYASSRWLDVAVSGGALGCTTSGVTYPGPSPGNPRSPSGPWRGLRAGVRAALTLAGRGSLPETRSFQPWISLESSQRLAAETSQSPGSVPRPCLRFGWSAADSRARPPRCQVLSAARDAVWGALRPRSRGRAHGQPTFARTPP